MRKVRVHLHGRFRAYHDGPIEVSAATVWDAVEAVTMQVKGFKPDALTGRQKIQVVDHPTIESLKKAPETDDIHIIPALTFGKDGGLIQTVIGVTLIVASFFVGGPAWLAPFLLGTGISMTAGGLMQMLMPVPQIGANNGEEVRSKYLPGIQNTVKLGTTIPLGYGRMRCGGHIMSLNVDAKDVL